MDDCDEMIADLRARAREQVRLALIAQAEPVRGMHLELAMFRGEQVRVVEEVCEDTQHTIDALHCDSGDVPYGCSELDRNVRKPPVRNVQDGGGVYLRGGGEFTL